MHLTFTESPTERTSSTLSTLEIVGYDPAKKTDYSEGFMGGGGRINLTSADFNGNTFTGEWVVIGAGGSEVPGKCVREMNTEYTAGTGTCELFVDGKWWVYRKEKITKLP